MTSPTSDDPENYVFDVTTADHDDVKGGGDYPTTRSRVVVSRKEYPTYGLASDVAACIAAATHRAMPIKITPRY